MAQPYRDRKSPVKRPPWTEKLSNSLLRRVDAEIDARAESAAATYRRWNLLRYIGARSFRTYVRRRREAIRQYEVRQRQRKSRERAT